MTYLQFQKWKTKKVMLYNENNVCIQQGAPTHEDKKRDI